jgi:ABC-2 type transport system ATP-binding protein
MSAREDRARSSTGALGGAAGPGAATRGPGAAADRAGAAPGAAIVTVRELTVRYGALTAVDRLDLEVRAGEMFGLIGPDGAGKTSTLRSILGLVPPAHGTLRACGLDPQRQRMALSGAVGYLSQRFSLYGDLSVEENVAFFAEIHGVRGWKPRRDELLERMRLSPFRRRLAAQLSGGMKQKLALACTLIHTPRLLVLDEPTTGVDPVSRRDFWKLLVALQREGLTILMTTPYLDEAERCQRVGLMHQGRLLVLDTPEALRAQWRGAMLEVMASPKRQAAQVLRGHAAVLDLQTFGERFHVTLSPARAAAAEQTARELEQSLRAAGLTVELVRPTTPTLEDIFLSRVRAAAEGQGTDGEVRP